MARLAPEIQGIKVDWTEKPESGAVAIVTLDVTDPSTPLRVEQKIHYSVNQSFLIDVLQKLLKDAYKAETGKNFEPANHPKNVGGLSKTIEELKAKVGGS